MPEGSKKGIGPFLVFGIFILISIAFMWMEVYVYNSHPIYVSEEERDASVEQFGIFAPYL